MVSNENVNNQEETKWLRCSNCRDLIYKRIFFENQKVCPLCNFHYRLTAHERIELLFDKGSFVEINAHLSSVDLLGFKTPEETYEETLRRNQEKTGLKEACITGRGKIKGVECIGIVFDFFFMGGSMGTVVGEKVARAFEEALSKELPLVAVTASGGARMQEGIFSLMQMAKTSLLAGRFKRESQKAFVTLMTNPTTGGVLASFASLADFIIAEPGALIGFAGPRVIEKTVKAKLPKGFQTAEFLYERGLIDMVIPRSKLSESISEVISIGVNR